ncbi:hypothetical protein Gohar_013544, partial [Gossypium harknessii]|nr:hypothetical protein [Gossypium harknessii]
IALKILRTPLAKEGIEDIRVWRGNLQGNFLSEVPINYYIKIDNLEDKKFTRSIVNEEWCPPLGSNVKVNFDAACNQSLVRSGSGVVVRNSPCEILASKQTLHKEIASPFTAKGYACFQALLLGNHLGLSS